MYEEICKKMYILTTKKKEILLDSESKIKKNIICNRNNIMRILTGFVIVQDNIKPEVLKVQTELARSVQ